MVLMNIYEEILNLKRKVSDEKRDIENSCIILADFAHGLKDNEMIIMFFIFKF